MNGTYQDLIKECMLIEPRVNMSKVMAKLLETSPRKDYVNALVIKDRNLMDGWIEIENQAWSNIFHPILGHCHTFNMGHAKNLSIGFESSLEIIFNINYSGNMNKKDVYYHEESELFDPMKSKKLASFGLTRARLAKVCSLYNICCLQ